MAAPELLHHGALHHLGSRSPPAAMHTAHQQEQARQRSAVGHCWRGIESPARGERIGDCKRLIDFWLKTTNIADWSRSSAAAHRVTRQIDVAVVVAERDWAE